MDQKERMLAGLPFNSLTGDLTGERTRAKILCKQLNEADTYDPVQMRAVLHELLGRHGERFYIEPPFRCDYGYNIEIGECFYANYNLSVLDCAKVTIGDRVLIGPNVCITTAGHPIHPLSRSKYEYAIPIRIGSDVWIGANVVINPGVTIGDGSVIGSGAVVTKDVPPYVVAAGNPCRVIRTITDEDIAYYYKDRPFDVDDYLPDGYDPPRT